MRDVVLPLGGPGQSPIARRPLPATREAVAGSAQKPQVARVVAPVAKGPGLAPGQEAVAEALAQLDFGEAPLIGTVGDTGAGKTTLLIPLIEAYQRRSPGTVLIIDDKGMRSRFVGQERRDVEDLRQRPVDYQQGRVIIFRGIPARGEKANAEEIAELAWARVGRARKTLIVIDELVAGREELSKNTQWRKDVTWVPRSFTTGREPGVAVFWGAQSPQLVPIDAFEQSSAICCFRLAGVGLQRLKERNYLLGGAGDVIPRLHGPPDPPASRGDFVLLRRGQPWNGKVYKFEGGR